MRKDFCLLFLVLASVTSVISCSQTQNESNITLVARSVSRMVSDDFYAGEKITFTLEGVQEQSLFWIFNENRIMKGPAHFEYYFPYRESSPEGGTVSHRVDVFYKSGDNYYNRYFRFSVINNSFTTHLQFFEDALFLNCPQFFDEKWILRNVSFSLFRKGAFLEGRSFVIAAESDNSSMIRQKLTEMSKNAFEGFIQQSGVAWVQYEFSARNSEQKLNLIEPLKTKNDLYNRPHPRLSNIFGPTE